MHVLDVSFEKPEMNLALDEVLLDAVEDGRAGETLRFWESPIPFVVLGVSQRLADHVNEEACIQDGVPILRRCSAGGCVLQGPGCLNFALALRLENHEAIQTIRGSYGFILGGIVEALKAHGIRARHAGISDLAVEGPLPLKVSGNAQRRRRNAILHHGTLVYAMEPADMERYLKEPADRPDYRGQRAHTGFVANIPLASHALRDAVCAAFHIQDDPQEPDEWEMEETSRLAHEKYSSSEWNRRR